jgi:hypothetical protein
MLWLLQCLDGESSSGESPVPQMTLRIFLVSSVDAKQTLCGQMRGQDRPMPCGVWAAKPDLRDNTCPAVGEARRPGWLQGVGWTEHCFT